VFLRSWKCVLRVNVSIMSCAVEIILFETVNVELVQTNRNHLHVSRMNAWVSYFNGFVWRNTKCFSLWNRVCFYAAILFFSAFRISNHNFVVNDKVIVFLCSWKCVLRINVNNVFRAVQIIMFDIVNVALVQTNWNHLHVCLLKRRRIILQRFCM
jgi:hypothetical protein